MHSSSFTKSKPCQPTPWSHNGPGHELQCYGPHFTEHSNPPVRLILYLLRGLLHNAERMVHNSIQEKDAIYCRKFCAKQSNVSTITANNKSIFLSPSYNIHSLIWFITHNLGCKLLAIRVTHMMVEQNDLYLVTIPWMKTKQNKRTQNIFWITILGVNLLWVKLAMGQWGSSTGLTAVSKFKPRLSAQWAVGTHRKCPSRMEKETSKMNWTD